MSIFSNFESYDNCEPIGAALPKVEIDKKYYKELNLAPETPNNEFLRSLVRRGVKELKIDQKPNKNEYYDKIKYELEV